VTVFSEQLSVDICSCTIQYLLKAAKKIENNKFAIIKKQNRRWLLVSRKHLLRVSIWTAAFAICIRGKKVRACDTKSVSKIATQAALVICDLFI